MNPDLKFCIRSLSRFIYYVTEEEDRFIRDFRKMFPDHAPKTKVYNSAFGMVPIDTLMEDWKSRMHREDSSPGIHEALIGLYKDDPSPKQNFYLITDPERWLTDPQVVRRVLNVIHQQRENAPLIKFVIFVGSRLVMPPKLQPYVEVIHDKGLNEDQIHEAALPSCERVGTIINTPLINSLKGLSAYGVVTAANQSIVLTKKEKNPRVDSQNILDYKRRQLRKTDLLSYVDVSKAGFDQVGGLTRFKSWADKTKAAWSDEGQKFGLTPPRGVLLTGVWGCGKSISVKALGNAWGLPVVQLDMGRLRSSGVGDSEANVLRAVSLIESVAPVLCWVDEAEKSFSGGKSSNSSDAGTTSRMIGILSTWLQETTAPICFAMTSNSIKDLPVEFIRRTNERFFFDLPSEEERVDILKIHLKKNGQDPSTLNLASLAEDANHMVGSEIEQAIQSAMIESFHAKSDGLSAEILSQELKKKPRIFKTMADEFKDLLTWVGWDADSQDGVRARWASEPSAEFLSTRNG